MAWTGLNSFSECRALSIDFGAYEEILSSYGLFYLRNGPLSHGYDECFLLDHLLRIPFLTVSIVCGGFSSPEKDLGSPG